jgi:phospholipid/cholesterol/gamma-HCH transport system substrate-binding protein
MAKKTSSFLVGLFVIFGVALFAGAIIWIGVTGYFQPGNTYVTYFNESVQGLQKDSVVKYRGVDVGRVEQIRIAPDNRLVAIIMKLNMRGDVSKTVVAQLAMAGITGYMFVDLDYRKPEDPDLSPKLTFPSEYPVIPSKPSEFARILSGINEVVTKLNAIDFKAIADQLQGTMNDISGLFRGEKLQSILTRVNEASANLKSLTAKTDSILGKVKVDGIIKETAAAISDTRAALHEAKSFVTDLKDNLNAMRLPETMTRTRSVIMEAQVISENLKRTTESLEKFSERIYERPPDLLFGKPPKPRWNEAGGESRP